MAATHIHIVERNDLDSIREENLVLREELQNLRDEMLNERKTRTKLIESRQDFSFEGRKKVHSFADSVVEKNEQLKERITSLQGRPLRISDGSRFGGRDLEALGNRLESMHRDLMESRLMSKLKGKRMINQGRFAFKP